MKYFNIILVLILCLSFGYSFDTNVTGLGNKQVESDNPLFIDFSNTATSVIFGVIVILLVLSFLVILHPINSFIFFITTIILIANGFNILISFIMMLVSISLIVTSSKK